jgi:hypothetical protein
VWCRFVLADPLCRFLERSLFPNDVFPENTLAISGHLQFAHVYFTKPHYNRGLVVSASFRNELEELVASMVAPIVGARLLANGADHRSPGAPRVLGAASRR